MLNLSCLFGTALLCCMLSYLQRCTACTQRMASYCSWEPLGTGGCKSAGWPPRPAASRGSPSIRGIPARPPRSPAALGPCHGRQISAHALLQSGPLSSGVPAPFRRRSRALPERRWNGAGTPQAGLPGTILPEQLLEQLPERSRKRRVDPHLYVGSGHNSCDSCWHCCYSS